MAVNRPRRESQRLVECNLKKGFKEYLASYELSIPQYHELFEKAKKGFLELHSKYEEESGEEANNPYDSVEMESSDALWLVFGEYMHTAAKVKAESDRCVELNLQMEKAIFDTCNNNFWERSNYDKMEPILLDFIRLNVPCRSIDPDNKEQDDEHLKLKKLVTTECSEYLDGDNEEENWEAFKQLFGDPFFLVQDGPRCAVYFLNTTNYNSVQEQCQPLHEKPLPAHNSGILIAKAYNETSDVRLHTHNGKSLVSKKIPHFLFCSNQWTSDYPPHEIATHRILQNHYKLNPLTPMPCDYLIHMVGVTRSEGYKEHGLQEEVHDYFYYTEGGSPYFEWIQKNFRANSKKYHKFLKKKQKEGDKSWYKNNKSEWEIARTKDFIKILTAIKFMHVQEIAHRDLKLENVVFVGGTKSQADCVLADYGADCKIIDFGVNQRFSLIDPNMKVLDQKGTQEYMSPECFNVRFSDHVPEMEFDRVDNNCTYDAEKNDVWTLGYMLFSMLTAKKVYEDCGNCDPKFRAATSGSYLPVEKRKKTDKIKSLLKGLKRHFCVTNLAVELLESILCPEKERATMDQIFQHPWLNDNSELNDMIKAGSLDCLIKIYPGWAKIKAEP